MSISTRKEIHYEFIEKGTLMKENSFRLYWLDGTTEVIKGESFDKAFTNRGYTRGAIRALDFFSYGEEQTHTWNSKLHDWVPKDSVTRKLYSVETNLI